MESTLTRIDIDTHKQLRKASNKLHIPMVVIIRDAVSDFVGKMKE